MTDESGEKKVSDAVETAADNTAPGGVSVGEEAKEKEHEEHKHESGEKKYVTHDELNTVKDEILGAIQGLAETAAAQTNTTGDTFTPDPSPVKKPWTHWGGN